MRKSEAESQGYICRAEYERHEVANEREKVIVKKDLFEEGKKELLIITSLIETLRRFVGN